jgi:hypothetical protein
MVEIEMSSALVHKIFTIRQHKSRMYKCHGIKKQILPNYQIISVKGYIIQNLFCRREFVVFCILTV